MDDDPMMRYSSVSEIEQQMKGRRMPLWAWLLAFLVLAVSLSAFFLYQQKSSEVVSGLSRPQAASQSDVRIGEEGNMVSKTDGKQQAIVEEPIPTPEATPPANQPTEDTKKKPEGEILDISTLRKEFHSLCMPLYKEELAAYRTNASAESFNAKIKAFRTQFRGVTDIKFFMYRLTKLYS